jgi:hypothetical protein
MATEMAALLGLLQELCRLLKLPTVLRNAATLDEAARRRGQVPLAYLVLPRTLPDGNSPRLHDGHHDHGAGRSPQNSQPQRRTTRGACLSAWI